jgi:hypothetical protein
MHAASSGVLSGHFVIASLITPQYYQTLTGVDVGLRQFNCSSEMLCNGNGVCVQESVCACAVRFAWMSRHILTSPV